MARNSWNSALMICLWQHDDLTFIIMRFAKSFEDKRRIWLKRPTYQTLHSNQPRIRRLRSKGRQYWGNITFIWTIQGNIYGTEYFRRDIAILLIYRRCARFSQNIVKWAWSNSQFLGTVGRFELMYIRGWHIMEDDIELFRRQRSMFSQFQL